MAQIKKRESPPGMQPPMTPMIDCVFQLLIFFMLMPSFQAGEGYLTTNLPSTSGPAQGKAQVDVQRIKIELFESGPKGEGVEVTLNENQNFGSNFEGLLAALQNLRSQGLAPNHPVLISPTMACRHKWVVRAFDMAVAARFTDIHFAVPYE